MMKLIVDMFTDFIIMHSFNVTFNVDYVCSTLVPLCTTEQNFQHEYKQLQLSDYVQRVLSDKPEEIDGYLDQLYEKVSAEESQPKIYKILQLSDWHVDFRYQEGTNKKCKEEICC